MLSSLLFLAAGAYAATTPPPQTVDMVAMTWYAGWHSDDFPLDHLSWEKYTNVLFSFATTTDDVTQLSLSGSNGNLLPQFVSLAQENDVVPGVSVGGWTGSQFFSSAVATPENRTAFVKTITDFATNYSLGHIDFDWEYPGKQGVGCNTISPNDTANYLAFLQELRQDPVGANLTLSAAVTLTPFADETGNPSASVAGFADVLDFISIMVYDVWGPWSPTTGPNAPLNDTCVADPSQKQGSAVSAVQAWTAAGIPAHQIVLAVASYGHGFTVSPSNAFANGSPYDAFDATNRPSGDKWSGGAGPDVCGVQQAAGATYNFFGLMDTGFLTDDGEPVSGISYFFDDCSQTPYVYNSTSQVMVAFDDACSFSAKGSFIKDNNLRGFSLWEAGGDFDDILLDSIREACGFTDDDSCSA